MAVPQTIHVSGAVNTGPPCPSSTFPSLSQVMDLSVSRQYQVARSSAFSVNSPGPAWLNLMAGITLSAVRFIGIRVNAGSLIARITTTAGALQLVPLSDLWILHNPLAGTEITTLEVQGTANIEMLIAGDS